MEYWNNGFPEIISFVSIFFYIIPSSHRSIIPRFFFLGPIIKFPVRCLDGKLLHLFQKGGEVFGAVLKIF